MKRLVGFAAVLLVLAGATVVMANTSASPSKFSCPGARPFYGRTDGVCFDQSTLGAGATYGAALMINGDVDRPLSRVKYAEVFEDFMGATIIPANGALDAAQGPWAVKDTSAAGSPALAIKGDADDGQFEMTLASTSEAENLDLYWNDEQNIDTDRGPVMIVRLQVAVAVSAGKFVFGFASARNDTLDSIANNAWFLLPGTMDLNVESDDATTDDDDNDTGVDLVAGTWYDFKVDCSVPTDCDFFYRSTLGGDWTELLSTTPFSLGADAQVQPYFQLQKASGTSVPSVLIDFVEVYWKRTP
jgi:hypothetical protein